MPETAMMEGARRKEVWPDPDIVDLYEQVLCDELNRSERLRAFDRVFPHDKFRFVLTVERRE